LIKPTTKRNRTRIFYKRNTLRIATWNIQSWNTKSNEVLEELTSHNIDICAISETKKKGKGSQQMGLYIMIYSGKPKNERASAGVGLLLHQKFLPNIDKISYTNERILQTTLLVDNKHIELISVYAPDISKSRSECEDFYSALQDTLDTIPHDHHIIIMRDLNARVGNDPIPGIKQRFNEEAQNNNGDLLIAFCTQYNLRINNTFYDHALKYKYTWSNSRGQQSVIDYIITNKHFLPKQILDVRTLNSANIGSDHDLVLCKIRLKYRVQNKKNTQVREKLNVELLSDSSIQHLYSSRLREKISTWPIEENDNIDSAWKTLHKNIIGAAEEAVGKRKIRRTTQRSGSKTSWFTDEVKEITTKKKIAYLRYKSLGTQEARDEYISARNYTIKRIRQIKEEHWQAFTKDMEHDLYGSQKKIWKMLRNRKLEVKETIQLNKISGSTWWQHFSSLYNSDTSADYNIIIEEDNVQEEERIELTEYELEKALISLKNRKAPSQDDICNEFLKYGGRSLTAELIKLFRKIIDQRKIPTAWKTSITIPIFKRGDKKCPENYRGITLLSAVFKLFTKVILNKIQPLLLTCEEQHGFRSNRSTTDALFIVRQIAEKSIEFAKPAYMCFVDLKQAFDKVRLGDVITILQEKGVSKPYLHLIKDINWETKTRIRVNEELTDEIQTPTGIRQGDSLSPALFNVIMDKIIEAVKRKPGYQLGSLNIQIVCYADDAVLIADSEDKLQELLNQFCDAAKTYNMAVSTSKTKTLTIAKEPVQCKLVTNDTLLEQVTSFKYLGGIISSDRNTYMEVRHQTNNAARISGLLRDITWRNRHMTTESKIKIYKAVIRPIMTYGAESRADTAKTKQLLKTTEMNTLRAILGKTRLDRMKNIDILERCNIQTVTKFVKNRRKAWNEHVDRAEQRLIKLVRDAKPNSKRPPGRPPKRWANSWQSSFAETP